MLLISIPLMKSPGIVMNRFGLLSKCRPARSFFPQQGRCMYDFCGNNRPQPHASEYMNWYLEFLIKILPGFCKVICNCKYVIWTLTNIALEDGNLNLSFIFINVFLSDKREIFLHGRCISSTHIFKTLRDDLVCWNQLLKIYMSSIFKIEGNYYW